MSEKTPGQVAYEASEAAEWNVSSDPWTSDWYQLSGSSQQEWEKIAQAVLAAHGPQWQPIETASRDGGGIMLVYPGFIHPVVGYWDEQLGIWRTVGGFYPYERDHSPIYWQPLSELPNETKE